MYMSYSFEYIDIILLAMIAGFIFLRLRGILGKKTGFEEDIKSSFPHEAPKTKPSVDLNADTFIGISLPLQHGTQGFFHKTKTGELTSITINDVTNMRATFTQSIQNHFSFRYSNNLFSCFFCNWERKISLIHAHQMNRFVVCACLNSIFV